MISPFIQTHTFQSLINDAGGGGSEREREGREEKDEEICRLGAEVM